MKIELGTFRQIIECLDSDDGLPSHEERYRQLCDLDPFPSIPPALLHAGHIASYAVATGMIEPFEYVSDDSCKPATYLVPLEGEVRYKKEDGSTESFVLGIKEGAADPNVRESFDLLPNSLCYVTLRPQFRMPNYLAGRFNLLIRDVYRGLLVGTGPLVDPGFVGQLSIPLHNFTSNTYCFRAGEGFVYFEFTKLSWTNSVDALIPDWCPPHIDHQPPFPRSKNRRKGLDDYIHAATGGGPAQNALLGKVRRAEITAQKTENRLRIITLAAIGAALLYAITVFAAWKAGVSIVLSAQQYTQAAQSEVREIHSSVKERLERLERLVSENPPAVPQQP